MASGTMRLGGYFMPMSIARDFATNLSLPVGDDTIKSNAHLQSTFNGWLAENNKFHILAASVTWPTDIDSNFGIIFISKFIRGGPEDQVIEEDEEALGVKKDIEGWCQNLELRLQWASFPDHDNITRWGTRPRPNPPGLVKITWDEMLALASRYTRPNTTA